MRRVLLTGLLGWFAATARPAPASAEGDPQAEMAAALAAQADLHPAPLVLPLATAAPRRAGVMPLKRSPAVRPAEVAGNAARAADRVSRDAQGQGVSQALSHQAQAAAAAAAGQAQSQAASQRAKHRPHR
jgi:hypothetical protein